jgi:hypothetical protein
MAAESVGDIEVSSSDTIVMHRFREAATKDLCAGGNLRCIIFRDECRKQGKVTPLLAGNALLRGNPPVPTH